MKFVILTLVLIFTSVLADDGYKCTSDGLHVDPNNCEIFYSCKNGDGTRQICPVGLIFNSDKLVCDHVQNVKDCQKKTVEEEVYKQCHTLGFKGCKTYPGPSDTRCCGADSACYNFGGSGGYNQCVKKH